MVREQIITYADDQDLYLSVVCLLCLATELVEYDPKGSVCTQVIKDRRNKSKYTFRIVYCLARTW